jgi:hypothetical protein
MQSYGKEITVHATLAIHPSYVEMKSQGYWKKSVSLVLIIERGVESALTPSQFPVYFFHKNMKCNIWVYSRKQV